MNLLPKEVAARLRVHDKTLARWRITGQGPKYLKFGRRVVYPLAEVERWESGKMRSAVSVSAPEAACSDV